MSEPDPFTRVYNKIVGVLKDHKLKVVSWNSTADPLPDKLTEGDLPEVQVRPTALASVIGDTSSTSVVQQSYDVSIASGDNRLGERLFPAQWQLFKALHAIKYGMEDLAFVLDLSVVSATTGLVDPLSPTNRGINGWASMWTITIHMSFDRNQL